MTDSFLTMLLTLAFSLWLAECLSRKGPWKWALLLAALVWAGSSVHQHVAVFPRPMAPEGFQAEALYARRSLPQGAVLATFQAGIFSYFCGHRVVNLDGVVNRDAFRALRDRMLGRFLAERKVDFVMDWEPMLERMLYPRLGEDSPVRFALIREDYFQTLAVLQRE